MENRVEVSKGFITGFQGLRGYAILLIFISHCYFGQNEYGINKTTWFGGLGVSVFIMMSGYLLVSLHKNEDVKIINLLKKRLKRFYPLHIVTLLLAVPFSIYALRGLDLKAWLALVFNSLLLQTWIPSSSFYFSYNSVSWYLSITVFFIVISPLVIKLWSRLNRKQSVYLIVGLIMFEFIWCGLLKDTLRAHWMIYIFPIVRSVDYIIGGGLYKISQYVILRKSQVYDQIGIISILLSMYIMVVSMNHKSEWFSVCFWTIPAILLVYSASKSSDSVFLSKVFDNIVVVKLGEISFEFFLIHQLVIRYLSVVMGTLSSHFIINMLIEFGIVIIAVLIWRKVFFAGRQLFLKHKR